MASPSHEKSPSQGKYFSDPTAGFTAATVGTSNGEHTLLVPNLVEAHSLLLARMAEFPTDSQLMCKFLFVLALDYLYLNISSLPCTADCMSCGKLQEEFRGFVIVDAFSFS